MLPLAELVPLEALESVTLVPVCKAMDMGSNARGLVEEWTPAALG
jgi:hypothetical protein